MLFELYEIKGGTKCRIKVSANIVTGVTALV